MSDKTQGRAQLDYGLLDVNFFSNPKICGLHRRFLDAGLLALIQIILSMSRATAAIIDDDALYYILEQRGVKKPQDFIIYVLEKQIILKTSEGYTNSRVIKDQESLFKRQDRYKRHAQQTSEKRLSNGKEPLKSEQLNTELLNTEDLVLYGAFDNREIKEALHLCRLKLRESKRDINQQTLEALCITKGTPERLLSALRYTATLTKAANVYDPASVVKNTTPGQKPKTTQQSTALETLKIIEMEALNETLKS